MSVRILLSTANPEAHNLRLAAEMREIKERVERAEHRRQKQASNEPMCPIEPILLGASRMQDLLGALELHQPRVLHFSGHGAADGSIIFEDNDGARVPVAPASLATVVGEFKCLQLVFLNACYSEAQAAGIVREVDCFIGMTRTVEDSAALCFAGTFYEMAALGSSIGHAFRLACAAMVVQEGTGCEDVPRLLTRTGVDAEQCFLIPPGRTKEPLAVSSKSTDQSMLRRNKPLSRVGLYAALSSFVFIAGILTVTLAKRSWSKEQKANVVSVAHDNGSVALDAATPKPKAIATGTEDKSQPNSSAITQNIQIPQKKNPTEQRVKRPVNKLDKEEKPETINRQDIIMHNNGPTQVNNIGDSHGKVHIEQNNK